MSDADDHEWLLARERGEDVEHVPAETRATYNRLAKLFEGLPRKAPTPGWQQRLLAKVDEQLRSGAAPRSRRRWVIAGSIAGLAAAAAILFLLLGRARGREMTASVVTTEIRSSNAVHRGGLHVGDTLVVHVDSARSLELRTYDGAGRLLARCTEVVGCTVERRGERRRFSFEIQVRVAGDLRVMEFTGDAIPTPLQRFEEDLVAAEKASVQVRQVGFFHAQ